jgi:hypothetical protein
MPRTLDQPLAVLRAADLHGHLFLARISSGRREGVSAGRHLLAAAAATSSLGRLGHAAVAIVAAAVLFGAYYLSLRMWPYGPCLICQGSGRNWGSNGKRHGICRACRGSGRRTRLGARILHTVKHGRGR